MIPYGRQTIDEDDIAAVAEVLRGDFLTGGPAVGRFEAALAETVQAPHAVACANGTAALHLAVLALDLGPGDIVVVPSVTFLASANVVRFVGANVLFADVDPDSGLLTAGTLREALTRAEDPRRVRAAIPVHLNGQSCDMEEISSLAAEYGFAVIEDACHALGGAHTAGGERALVGSASLSKMACFSFHPVKAVAMGEGGAVTTRDSELAGRLARLRSHGMTRDPGAFLQQDEARDPGGQTNPWYYEMAEPGFNYRACDMQCALGESQLRKLGAFLARRRALAARYDSLLASLANVVKPVPRLSSMDDGWHLYPVLIDFQALGLSRADVMMRLRDAGVGTQVHYIPVHRQPYYRALYPGLSLPGADAYYERCLSLPLFPAMNDNDVDTVVNALAGILTDAA
ncbi:UDP-4-amino-4,6-dideoxy-N-acetyl-beta-L-altrosamine transaminase [Denitrobaculum tricleocarpae]|uniref:UDP-4-amino-4, 6-dideoxy-N-acetyl-beta-L-altrosamine transaminase n=1 Tax=Denitrobaculum tricleocarpae TaxID=2591009 RepID=A0A545U2G5_9PROT|nr:UDP-4-amino-4,6-dideoxy-N-acetyl-beta-L-altrosamine transaminase [Denitrobaculum tricleocarpae]TQV83646.1 UDP-4-amino-4,6-dideoxy-N-acetyl-beta-L-altrosamine transaminase [Denitrobaculum tricleocarpae]